MSIAKPAMNPTVTADSETVSAGTQPRKTTRAVSPYQLNHGTEMRKAHVGPPVTESVEGHCCRDAGTATQRS